MTPSEIRQHFLDRTARAMFARCLSEVLPGYDPANPRHVYDAAVRLWNERERRRAAEAADAAVQHGTRREAQEARRSEEIKARLDEFDELRAENERLKADASFPGANLTNADMYLVRMALDTMAIYMEGRFNADQIRRLADLGREVEARIQKQSRATATHPVR